MADATMTGGVRNTALGVISIAGRVIAIGVQPAAGLRGIRKAAA